MDEDKDLENVDTDTQMENDVKEESTDITKADKKKKAIINKNTQEYVDKMISRRRKIFKISIILIIVFFVVAVSLTAFSINASLNNKIIRGISINGIDVSGLSVSEAEEKIKKQIESTEVQELNLKKDEFTTTVAKKDLDVNFKIEEATKKAFEMGRKNNIIVNNFSIIKTMIQKQNIDIETTYNNEMLEKTLDDVAENIPGLVKQYTYCIEDDELIITPGTDGIALDREALKNTILERFAKNITTKNESDLEIPVLEEKPDDIDLDKIYSEIHTEPQNAYIKEDPLEIVVDKDGVDFKISMDEAKEIISEKDKKEYIIPLKITKAKKTVKDLGAKAFPDRLSRYTTKYDASNRNRSTNLELAAGKINGTVVLPGQEFSYNKVVGKRTIENGYKDAAIYADGGVVDGLGGGICQISTTLYNAVLLANLEIVERRNHTYVPSYEKAGRDATVVYGSQDFVFKNTREYPIKIVASVKSGVASMTIMGIKQETEYTVKIRSAVTSTIPFKTQTTKNPKLAEGKEKVKQKGSVGYKAVCYRDLYLNGKKVKTELLSRDTYSPMKRIVEVGTKKVKKKTTTSDKTDKEPEVNTNTTETENTPEEENE